MIRCLDVCGSTLEGVRDIWEPICSHFLNQFNIHMLDAVDVDNIRFPILDDVESSLSVWPFLEEEIKEDVWDCASFNSPDPCGINFNFLKEFWEDIKLKFMRFLTEFHDNGRLVKGLNCIFIVLFPKQDDPQKLNYFIPISLVGCMSKVVVKVHW